MKLSRYSDGFTIVELLIVIVVIAILASISVVAYNGIQQRSRAVAAESDIKNIDKAFRLLAIEQGRTTWWLDAELTGTANPTIDSVISATNMKNYMQSRSSVSGLGTSWAYDNDNNIYGGCNAADLDGVNLIIYTIDQSIAQVVDKDLDDGNLNCGSITYTSGNMRYSLSAAQLIN